MKTFHLIILSLLSGFTAQAQVDTLRWFEGDFPLNTEAGQHSIWYGLSQLEYLRFDDEGFDSFIPQAKGDSIRIRYLDDRHLQIQLIREGLVLQTIQKKMKIKEDRIVLKRKWLVGGLPPLIWALGWRATRINKLEEGRIEIRQSKGGLALIGIFPFTAGAPAIENVILEK